MRTAVLVILVVLLLCPNWSGDEPAPRYRGPPRVTASQVPLDAKHPARTRLGALTYLGGLRLSSRDRAFGGFSAMRIVGDRFLLLSDFGLTFAFRLGADWTIREPRIGGLPDGPGPGWLREQRDSESLTADPASGRVWIGFEDANAIWRFDRALTRTEAQVRPAAMRGWSENGGPEAMVRLRSGRFLVFSESGKVADQAGTRTALAYDRDPTAPRARSFAFTYLPPYGYSPTDAAELPDGRLLVLNRDASLSEGFTARLVLIDLAGLRPGARLRGVELARFAAPVIHDNFEALAVTREGADTIVWLASDDNAPSWFQRTLLLKFRFDPQHAKSPPSLGKAGR